MQLKREIPLTGPISHSMIMAEWEQTGVFRLSYDGGPLIEKTAGSIVKESDFRGKENSKGPNMIWADATQQCWKDSGSRCHYDRVNMSRTGYSSSSGLSGSHGTASFMVIPGAALYITPGESIKMECLNARVQFSGYNANATMGFVDVNNINGGRQCIQGGQTGVDGWCGSYYNSGSAQPNIVSSPPHNYYQGGVQYPNRPAQPGSLMASCSTNDWSGKSVIARAGAEHKSDADWERANGVQGRFYSTPQGYVGRSTPGQTSFQVAFMMSSGGNTSGNYGSASCGVGTFSLTGG